MFLDERTEFADATALSTSGTGRALLGDVIDLGVGRDIGQWGVPLYLVVQVTTAVTSAGAATVTFELVSDAAAAIATDGSASLHYASAAIGKATLVAGYEAVKVPVPMENPAYERYLGVITNIGTAALTAGAVNAFLTQRPSGWKAYPDATN